MFEDIQQHRAAVAENIQKAMEIGFTGGELEKAHKVGDVHPNGKWVWTQLPSGKFDWRVIKKTSAGSGAAAPSTAQKTAHSGEDLISKIPGLKNLKEYLTTFNSKYTDFDKVSLSKTPKGNWDVRYDGHRLGIMNGDQISESVVKKMGFHLSKEEKEKMREDSFAREKEKREKLAKESKQQTVNMPTTFDEAKKMGKVDVEKVNSFKVPQTLYGCKRDLRAYGKASGWSGGIIDDVEYDLKRAVNMKIGTGWGDAKTEEEKLQKIQSAADKLVTAEAIVKRISKVQSDLNKLKKQFLESTGRDFTEAQIEEWLNKYETAEDAPAVVRNTWRYAMGRIGSSTGTIQVGKGKEKQFDNRGWDKTTPNWRPIGMLKYNAPNWNRSGYMEIKVPIQSWEDVERNVGDTENWTLYVYKHPKQ